MSAFTAGTTTNISSGTTAITVPVGDYFRFGVALRVTNNANPEAGTAYDRANQDAAGPAVAMPATLGLAGFAYAVTSTDTAGTSLIPLPGTTAGNSTAQPTAYPYGTAAAGNVNGGNVGTTTPIAAFDGTPTNFQDPTQVASLGYFTGTTATYAFRSLAYRFVNSQPVTLTPTLLTAQTFLFHRTAAGTTDVNGDIVNDPAFAAVTAVADGDTVNTLTPIVFTVAGPPLRPPAAYLTASNPAVTPNGIVTVVKTASGYTPGTATFSPPIAAGYVQANGFVAGDVEAYGLSLLVGGVAPTAAQINDLVSYLNGNASGGVVYSRTGTLTPFQTAIFNALPAADTIAFVSSGTPAASPAYFGFDLSGFTADGTFTVTSITAVPEPATVAGAAVGVVALVRRRRQTF